MQASVLAPAGGRLHNVRGDREAGPPASLLQGWPTQRTTPALDRLRAAVANSGYSWPTGRVTVTVDPPLPDRDPGAELALALAVLLSDPSHAHLRQPNLIAWGSVTLDGGTPPVPPPSLGDLPAGAWVGRFWRPADRLPDPREDAVLTIFDVTHLDQAWDVVVSLVHMEAGLQKATSNSASERG